VLTRLVIQDVVLIDKLALTLEPGLNVFTGETGAGKSIVLDALGLALGARGDAGLIRNGAAQACVTAEFSSPAPSSLIALTEEQGLTLEDPVILRRVVGKDGKSRALINDQPVGVNLLKQIGELLLEIHGQFETHGLLNPATHKDLLDAFADHDAMRKMVAAVYTDWQMATKRLNEGIASRERARAEEDFLRSAVAELEELAPVSGETAKLAERRASLQHREKILEALQSAEHALNSEHGATAALAQAGKALARVADKAAGLQELLTDVDRAAHDVQEASRQLARFAGSIDAETTTLEQIEERLFALRAVARKHGVDAEALPALQQDLKARLNLLEDQGDQLTTLSKAAAEAKAAYAKIAGDLSAKRKKASVELARLVGRELPPLKLERAQFVVDVTPLPEDQWGPDGMDRIAFLAATNPGVEPGPLQKVASGGELARFMLALKVVLAAIDPVPTIVFDEVDSGIGGATASAVGERLAKLAKHVQILVVTHSPQVAALGAHHVRVIKQTKAKQALTAVEALDDGSRIEEIARMLAGATITDAARKAAVSLIGDGSPNTRKTRPQRMTKTAAN